MQAICNTFAKYSAFYGGQKKIEFSHRGAIIKTNIPPYREHKKLIVSKNDRWKLESGPEPIITGYR